MFELVQVSESAYYIESPARIGLLRTGEREVCLIDSGSDRDAGKKIRKMLDENRWTLSAIYNTHSHADHIGGNQYLQQQYGCRVYAPGIERDFTEHPVLEPLFLYGGNAPRELRHKFLMAQGSHALALTQDCLPEGVKAVPLPGHSFDMTGFRTQENIVYLADCLSSRETMSKYGISFLVDVAACLETLEAVQRMEARLFIPAHAEPTEDIVPLAKANVEQINRIGGSVLDICREPHSFEEILARLFERFALKMTFEQHALVGSTVRSYLTWLHETGKLQAFFENNRLLFQTL